MESNKSEVAACFPLFLHYIETFPFVDIYFDTFAFKSKQFPDVNNNVAQKRKLIFHKWPENNEEIVDSAFGTFGIYRKNDLNNLKYTIEYDESKKCKCEHVSFNENLQAKTGKTLRLLTWFKMVV